MPDRQHFLPAPHRGPLAALPVVMLVLMLFPGCAREAGVIFEPLPTPVQWPGAPEPARIFWIGQLERDADLKPAVNGLEAFGQAVFGKKDARTMLTPFSICTDGGSRVFVADSNGQCVHMFNLDTRQYAILKPDKKQPAFGQPVGIAWDAAADEGRGRLLVSDSIAGAIFAFDAAGKSTGTLGQGLCSRPTGIAVEPGTRRILVADAKAHQLVVLSPDGALHTRVGARGTALGEFNFPTAVTTDTTGQIYVCDTLNFRVQMFNAQYKPVRSIGKKGDLPGYFSQPKSVAVDHDNHLYVVDAHFENVQLFDSEGRVLMDFGEEGRGPGQFWLPAGIFIDRATPGRSRIWVADSYNRRIQLFEYRTLSAETQP